LSFRDFVFLKEKPWDLKHQYLEVYLNSIKPFCPIIPKKGLDLRNASKFQLAIIGWKAWVTKHAGANPNQRLLEN